jgi:signal transduction histidine kinase
MHLSLRSTSILTAVFVGVLGLLSRFSVTLPPWSDTDRSLAQNIANLGLGIMAAGALLLAARAIRHSKRMKVVWILLAAAFVVDGIGNGIWLIYENVLGIDPYPSIADIAYLSYYPLCVAGVLLLPTPRQSRLDRIKQALDIGVVAVASALLYWTVIVSPLLGQSGSETWTYLAVTVAYPALDLVVIWCLAVQIVRRQVHRSLLILAGSALCMAIADSVLNYETVIDAYVSGNSASDVFYTCAYLFAIWAGLSYVIWQRHANNQEAAAARSLALASPSPSHWSQAIAFILPYFWVLVAFLLLIREQNQLRALVPGSYITEITAGIGIIMGLVLLRQILTFHEKNTLSSQLTKLLNASHHMTASSQTHELNRVILEQLRIVANCDHALLLLKSGPDSCTTVTLDNTSAIATTTSPLTDELRDSLDAYRDSREGWRFDRASILRATPVLASHTGLTHPVGGWTVAPLVINDSVLGVIAAGRAQSASRQRFETMVLFAHQAASLLVNAELRKQEAFAAAQQAAVEERGRLARELHDSVSQALFGIVMGTYSLRGLIAQPAQQITDALEFIVRLSEGALAEMRALIFELRPESLKQEGLLRALQRQTEFLCRRHELDAHVSAASEPLVSIEVKEVLYRIAIEAVQNSIKHSRASRVDISLSDGTADQKRVVLEVKDDGRGFDPQQDYEGHLGLVSMRERAARVGGSLAIESCSSCGTLVRVSIPA